MGILTETLVNLVTARRVVGFIRPGQGDERVPTISTLWSFSGPLFAANAMGVLLQPLTVSLANGALAKTASGAAFGIVKSFTWFFSSTLFAMQAMTLARADTVPNLKAHARFTLLPVGVFSGLILVVAFVEPARRAVLGGLFDIDNPVNAAFVVSTLPIALALPVLMAVRATCRGLLMRGSRTAWVTVSSFTALLALLAIWSIDPSAAAENGALVAYACWMGAMALETVVLLGAVARVGVLACVSEGTRGRRPREAVAG